ncbi:rhomboid family intramembrane serine protease [Microbispora sp. NPDC049125]|uniref:rhomboid family intramembrane serine protease n=1 Tax=Microbispora sp. NPDC049125 TaxID=3154929 RepID=UPI0034661BA9
MRIRPFPFLTAAVAAVTAVPSLVQLADTALLGAFRRDPALVRTGEWWRLATSLVFQDGGLLGTAFNLVTLLVIGTMAERALGRGRWLALYLAGAAAGQVAGMLYGTAGAGNSIAVCGLAGGVLTAFLARSRAADATPGRSDATPGRSDATPGRSDATPGRSETAPGRLEASVAAFYSAVVATPAFGDSTAAVVASVVVASAGTQLVAHRDRLPRTTFPALALAAGVVLTALSDLHGPALLAGLGMGAVLTLPQATPRRTRM